MVEVFVFYHPRVFLAMILVATIFFASRIPYLEMYSNFADLLPQEHPYIQLHNDVKDTFGGANNVVVAILSLIHISEPTRLKTRSRMPSSA